MPAARRGVVRDRKVDEILVAAQARVLDGGYDAMSVAAIARDLELSQNSIYWYFPSKDDLFAAVCRRHLEVVVASKPSGRGELAKVLWTADRMADLAMMRADLASRASHSETVADLHRDLEGWISTLLTSGITSEHSSSSDVRAIAFRAGVEGTIALDLPSRTRRRVVRWLFDSIHGS